MTRYLSALFASVILAVAFHPAPAPAQSRYVAPEGCRLIATLRAPSCMVRQVSSCPAGNVTDDFFEGRFIGRAYYSHPSMFLRYERADGMVAGHNYGPGTPERDAKLFPGETYTYERTVYRSEGETEPGDAGTEVLKVGKRAIITIGDRNYPVVDLLFEVTADGYLYKERAMLLQDPEVTLGVTSTRYDADGEVAETFSTIPEAISLKGDPDLGFFEPAPSCAPAS
ncbi:MAG: hypothetical protein AAF674_11795 [Pseudomonadota bacterium]